jgi:hypothetical protein
MFLGESKFSFLTFMDINPHFLKNITALAKHTFFYCPELSPDPQIKAASLLGPNN